MLSDPIFSRDSAGKLRTWQYEVDGSSWRTIAGTVDGKTVTSGWRASVAASQDTDAEQALFEARAAEQKKLERKYSRDTGNVDEARASGYKPMLAVKYDGWVGPCYSQPKLDGIRCLASRDGLWSRGGKPIVSCPHVYWELGVFFKRYPGAVLDGELYNHELRDDFNAITSIVKKTKPTDEDLEESLRVIQYHVYDVPGGVSGVPTFAGRSCFIANALDGFTAVRRVLTCRHGTPESLDESYAHFLECGYEGQMVRLDGPYEGKRSKQLMKRKEFTDDEYPFVRFEEGNGNWAGVAKSVVCRLPDGREFGAGIKGTRDFCAALDGLTPRLVTVRSPNLTPDGVPRFGVAVAFHDTAVREY